MPSVRMGIGIDPHANRLCRLFGFSGIYPIGSHFGSLVYLPYHLLDCLYLQNIGNWQRLSFAALERKKLQICKSPSSYYGQMVVNSWQI